MKIVSINNAPKYLHSYILTGYRINTDYNECFKSLFMVHNETLNCWTMIFNVIVSSVILFYTAHLSVAFIILWFSCIIHAPFSVGYHLFRCIDTKTHNLWRKLDIIFIIITCNLIYIALGWHSLQVQLFYFILYISIISSLCFIYDFISNIKAGEPIPNKIQHTAKIAFFVMIYLFPMLYNNDICFYIAFLSLFIGGSVYGLSFPEKYYPVIFDFIGNSHFIMHISLLFAHLSEYNFIYKNIK
jgi:predicted membrane channel-forming protein YqfA (hemolysin III family)